MFMTNDPEAVELVAVDATDGQIDEAEEMAEFFAAHDISGRDKMSYELAWDRTSD
jgi:hypothetical protein